MMKSIDNRQHNLIVEINNELLHDFFFIDAAGREVEFFFNSTNE